jgi:hypothetical protein
MNRCGYMRESDFTLVAQAIGLNLSHSQVGFIIFSRFAFDLSLVLMFVIVCFCYCFDLFEHSNS